MRVVEPFLMDAFEMSVGRYRDAVRRGFSTGAPPMVQNTPLSPSAVCTWNATPGTSDPFVGIDREAFPLTCVPWQAARDVCRFFGGDLPSEDQWEYAATAAGKARKTSYPWGNDVPPCAAAVIGRITTGRVADDTCATPFGPTAVDDPSWATSDVTPLGLVGMAGNVQEWLRDAFHPYDHPAWEGAGLRAELPVESDAPLRSSRGSSWADTLDLATGSTRNANSPGFAYVNVGFRCVRAAR